MCMYRLAVGRWWRLIVRVKCVRCSYILTSQRETLSEQLYSVRSSRAEANCAEILMSPLPSPLREKTAEFTSTERISEVAEALRQGHLFIRNHQKCVRRARNESERAPTHWTWSDTMSVRWLWHGGIYAYVAWSESSNSYMFYGPLRNWTISCLVVFPAGPVASLARARYLIKVGLKLVGFTYGVESDVTAYTVYIGGEGRGGLRVGGG